MITPSIQPIQIGFEPWIRPGRPVPAVDPKLPVAPSNGPGQGIWFDEPNPAAPGGIKYPPLTPVATAANQGIWFGEPNPAAPGGMKYPTAAGGAKGIAIGEPHPITRTWPDGDGDHGIWIGEPNPGTPTGK